MKNGQKLKLGDIPWTPQEISKMFKRQSLGMPKASPLHQYKHQVIFQCAIFLLLHALCVILGASLFLLCVYFIFCSINLDPSYFVLERDTLLNSYIEHCSFHFHCFLVFYFSSTAFSYVFSSI